MLLRKEVIQPHLPIRLPCYDFTPITSPTFDGSFRSGSQMQDVRCQIIEGFMVAVEIRIRVYEFFPLSDFRLLASDLQTG